MVELINTFINRSLNKSVTVKLRRTKKQVNLERLCYIVIRGRASFWAEDLTFLEELRKSIGLTDQIPKVTLS